jgi:hypothetical protein
MASSVEQEEIIVHDHRFDAMVRAIPTRVSRRGALRGFIAAFAAVLAVMRGTETAAHHTMTITPSRCAGAGRGRPGTLSTVPTTASGMTAPSIAVVTEVGAAGSTSTAVVLAISAATRYAHTWRKGAAKPVLGDRDRIE